ncbi:MAG: hypothetical protein ABJO41_13675 [Erythrobacter sp.]
MIWIFCLAMMALIAAGAQLDRQSRYVPSLAQYVPYPFRGFAQKHFAADALATEEPEWALIQAQRLVAARPLPAEHIRMLALAQAVSDENSGALATFQFAAQRGWRDPIVQDTMLRLAIAAEDPGESARRFAALIANPSSDLELLKELGPGALNSAASRQAFAVILAQSERWHSTFLRRGAQSLPPQIFAAVTQIAAERGARFECDQLRLAARIMGEDSEDAGSTLVNITAKRC